MEQLSKETFTRYRAIGKIILESGYKKGQWKSEHRNRFMNELGISQKTFSRFIQLAEMEEHEFSHVMTNFPSLYAWENYPQIEKQKRMQNEIQELINKKMAIQTTNVQLMFGDFREVGKQIPDESVQVILTDPPYGLEYLDLWDSLGELAERVLIPSGYLITYSGKWYLPQVMSKLSNHLNYFWTIALLLKERDLINLKNIYSKWKPILIFSKPPEILPNDYFIDVIEGIGQEKELHPWQQSTLELADLISKFLLPNGIILDPMAGVGSSLILARELNHKCIGIESDLQTFEIMKARLAEYENQK
jgi:site-specific DNA-methyltransferase (adenine-specific)